MKDALKRGFDLCISLVVGVLLSPVLFGVAALVRSRMGSPVLFKQRHPGLNGKPFNMYKFCTICNALDARGNPLNAERRTPFGRFLCSSSLDELPELYNILQGEMSLVKPRPLLMEYPKHYTNESVNREKPDYFRIFE